jgi:peptide/nickel transport system permease protein
VICFPVFFLILGVVVFVGQSLLTIMIVVGLFRWTGIARLTRAEFLRLKELDFVVAAKALGLSTPRILLRHMLPNAISPLLVAATFSVAAGLSIESALSFLGFGVREPIPSWGGLVRSSLNPAHWWIQVFPGLLIFMTVLCYNLVGDAIRDAMDPRLPR